MKGRLLSLWESNSNIQTNNKYTNILQSILWKWKDYQDIYNNIKSLVSQDVSEQILISFMNNIYSYSISSNTILEYFLTNNEYLILQWLLDLNEVYLFNDLLKWFLKTNLISDINYYKKSEYISLLFQNINYWNIEDIIIAFGTIRDSWIKLYYGELITLIKKYPILKYELLEKIDILDNFMLDLISYWKFVGEDKQNILESLVYLENGHLIYQILTKLKAQNVFSHVKSKVALSMIVKSLFIPFLDEIKEYINYMKIFPWKIDEYIQLVDYAVYLLSTQYKIDIDEDDLDRLKLCLAELWWDLDYEYKSLELEKSLVYNLIAEKLPEYISLQSWSVIRQLDTNRQKPYIEKDINNILWDDELLIQIHEKIAQECNLSLNDIYLYDFIELLKLNQEKILPYLYEDLLDGNVLQRLSVFVILWNEHMTKAYARKLTKQWVDLNYMDDEGNCLLELIIPGLVDNLFSNQLASLQILIKNWLEFDSESILYFLDNLNENIYMSIDNVLSLVDLYLNSIHFEDSILSVIYACLNNNQFDIFNYIMSYFDEIVIEDEFWQPIRFYWAVLSLLKNDLQYFSSTIKYWEYNNSQYNKQFEMLLAVLLKELNKSWTKISQDLLDVIIWTISQMTKEELIINNLKNQVISIQDYRTTKEFIDILLESTKIVLKKQ